MTTIPNAKMLAISSPYSRTGVLYEMYRDYYGRDDDEILVWQADSMTMNPTLSKKSIEKAYERDPEASASEYGAEFRSDLETFLKAEAIEKCIITDRVELPPLSHYAYTGFVDPSGGGSDAFTLAIGHEEERDGLKVKVLDLVRRILPPFDPYSVVKHYCEILKKYWLYEVTGDRYAAEWVVNAFLDNGITYTHCEKIKSQLYLELEPMINCREVELLDDKTLIKELKQLERRTGRQRSDVIDHPPRLKDDVANAVAGVMHGINTWVEPRIYLI